MVQLGKGLIIISHELQDVQKCKRYLDVLNGKTAALTALTLFVVGNLAVSGNILHLSRHS